MAARIRVALEGDDGAIRAAHRLPAGDFAGVDVLELLLGQAGVFMIMIHSLPQNPFERKAGVFLSNESPLYSPPTIPRRLPENRRLWLQFNNNPVILCLDKSRILDYYQN